MRFIKLLAIAALCLVSLACKKQPAVEERGNELMFVTDETVQNYIDGVPSEKEFVSYEYENDTDYFWKKAIYKDSAGNATKTIERELGADRLPTKEIITDHATLTTEIVVPVYSKDTYELLSKDVYEGEMKPEALVMKVKNNYDANGWLLSQEVSRFSTDAEYKNTDGNKLVDYFVLRMLPAKNSRPKGNFPVYSVVEKRTQYFPTDDEETGAKAGSIALSVETTFDADGYPATFKISRPDCQHDPDSEWYKVDKDSKGNIIAMTGYSNEKRDSISEANSKITFTYGADGMIAKIADMKYTPETKQFDRLHSEKEYKWIRPAHKLKVRPMEASIFEKSYCYGQERCSARETIVEKFENGEKTVLVRQGSYDGKFDPAKKVEMKDFTRTTTKYRIGKCDREAKK